jgi:hypothetical protein
VRWLAVVGALTVLGAVAVASLVLGARRDATATAARHREATEEIAALRSELNALRAQVGRQRATSWVRSSLPTLVAAPATPAPPATDEERLAADRTRAADTVSRVASRFHAERRDPAWSGVGASVLEQDLKQAGLGGSLRGVECATTMCQVALELGADSPEHLAERLTELPAFQTQVLYQHQTDSRPPRLTLFVARAGHELPLAPGRP